MRIFKNNDRYLLWIYSFQTSKKIWWLKFYFQLFLYFSRASLKIVISTFWRQPDWGREGERVKLHFAHFLRGKYFRGFSSLLSLIFPCIDVLPKTLYNKHWRLINSLNSYFFSILFRNWCNLTRNYGENVHMTFSCVCGEDNSCSLKLFSNISCNSTGSTNE